MRYLQMKAAHARVADCRTRCKTTETGRETGAKVDEAGEEGVGVVFHCAQVSRGRLAGGRRIQLPAIKTETTRP